MKEYPITFKDLPDDETGWECYIKPYEGMPKLDIGKAVWRIEVRADERFLIVKYYPVKQNTVLPTKMLTVEGLLPGSEIADKLMAKKAAETLIHTTIMF